MDYLLWFFIDASNKSRNMDINNEITLFDLGGIPKCKYNLKTDELVIYMKK